ncbi:3-hydroxy-9,10-secoandrosta-1,3,5(10)-triene-9,17-dione monooxygenase reductase subunit [Nocardia sp. SSK8]|uniref:3-hydroxy-9,10-secoandrosta-1,3,5(10)-triene-9, 17-dione monooxygenase reductase subunit n=1 Tax=Nocardia sp. SSK8 TaxID=3120154 RepID=UPI003009EF17
MTEQLPAIDGRQFRNVLGQFCTGITVITALDPDGAPIGFACQSFAALSLDPPLVLFCPTKGSRSWAAIEAAGKFCVNVLAEAQQPTCARFGSRETDKFAGVPWHTSDLGVPVLDESLATIECTVDSVVDGGDHYIVIGRVQRLAESETTNGRPLLFYRGQYTGIEPDKTTPAPWRADLDHFLTTTSLDTWL